LSRGIFHPVTYTDINIVPKIGDVCEGSTINRSIRKKYEWVNCECCGKGKWRDFRDILSKCCKSCSSKKNYERRGKRLGLLIDVIINMYQENLSLQRIATKFKVGYGLIRTILLENNVEMKKFGRNQIYSNSYKRKRTPEEILLSSPPKGSHHSLSTEFKSGNNNGRLGNHYSFNRKSYIVYHPVVGRLRRTNPYTPKPKVKMVYSDEYRKKCSERMKGTHLHLGYKHSPEVRAKMSMLLRERWKNPEYSSKVCHAILKGLNAERPNKKEKILLEFLDEYYPNQWKYVGDNSVNIGGRFPDFININGKKELVEMFGKHWHNIFEVSQRIEHYKHQVFILQDR